MESYLSKEYARDQDSLDTLQPYRDEFYLQPGVTYLDGNSLGLMSKRAEKNMHEVMESWKIFVYHLLHFILPI